ncbi:MAG TPA: hypothetical protein DIC64_00675 [Alphaproteobacteria bacterium]|nr:hypothetical protein [Alphaproteobacteria bacterium]
MRKTYILIGKRIEKSEAHPYGWKRVDFVPEDETCVVVLGGNGTENDEQSNGNAKSVDLLLKAYGLRDGVNVYSIIYRNDAEGEEHFIPYLQQLRSREVLFEKHGRKEIKERTPKQKEFIEKAEQLQGKSAVDASNPEISDPSYVENLFDKLLLYRISDLDGQRLPFEEAIGRVRKLNIVAHCHSAYLFLKLEDMMQQKMKEFGYSDEERKAIQKQLLCVAFAPYAPLGVSKSTMLSFGSMKDDEVWHQNAFHREAQNLDKTGEFKLSYFEEKLGNVFVASSMTEGQVGSVEHSFSNYLMPKRALSEEGEIMVLFGRNAVLNGVRGSKEGRLISNVRDLLCGDDAKTLCLFEKLRERGKKTYAKLMNLARKFALTKAKQSRGNL